jgi:hypothetical protein
MFLASGPHGPMGTLYGRIAYTAKSRPDSDLKDCPAIADTMGTR